MGFIELKQGCPETGEFTGCMGPSGPYIAVFDSELRFLSGHILASILAGLILMSILTVLKRKGKVNIPLYVILILSLGATLIIFFLLVYLVPVRVMY